jgi:hypothetical protein
MGEGNDGAVVEPKICDYCGCYITVVNQVCPGRDNGYCLEEVGAPGHEIQPRD